MRKYIDVDELLKQLNACKYSMEKTTKRQAAYNAAINDMCRSIDAMPAADVIEVKHGRWITDNNKQTKCSICGRPIPIRKVRHNGEVIWEDNSPVNYCPCCGAKMDKVEEEKHE